MIAICLALCLASIPVLHNDYVIVSRGAPACAAEAADCGERVVVALQSLALESDGATRRLERGGVAILAPGQPYRISSGSDYFEVAIRPDHPAALAPAEQIAPEKNSMLHDGADYFVFEERLAPGDTRARHSHGQRVVIQLNATRLQQWPDGAPELFIDTVPEKPSFSPPVVHKVKNVGDRDLAGIIVEFKPGRQER